MRELEGQGDGRSIDIRDDCDPADPTWDPTRGCTLKHGDTDFAEFNPLLPGEDGRLPAMGLGVHRVQCCIHPWMRGLIRVSEHSEH